MTATEVSTIVEFGKMLELLQENSKPVPLLCLKLDVEGIHQPAQLQLLLHGPGVDGGAHLAMYSLGMSSGGAGSMWYYDE